MEFRDLKTQYSILKSEIDQAIQEVVDNTNFISGKQVEELEEKLADYVGVKHCISCANGTDALTLALMTWEIGQGNAVFVPDFTFFASAETVAYEGARPYFVDVEEETYNISAKSLAACIEKVLQEGKYIPKVIVTVDLFGQPAEYPELRRIADKYNMYILEDAAQGFGGSIGDEKACSFGDISTTSFFPAKPLGCYGDGGAVFTDNDEWADYMKSIRIHGKGAEKYDNIRIGINSRLDTLQAAILLPKFRFFVESELEAVNIVANHYTRLLQGYVGVPYVKPQYKSSWAQYTIRLADREQRERVRNALSSAGIPTMIYYEKTMGMQKAFCDLEKQECPVAEQLGERVLSLPIHPYLTKEQVEEICTCLIKAL